MNKVAWYGAVIALAWSTVVRADNAPEGGQRRAQAQIVPKIDFACGTQLTVEYDGESLRKHNLDIAQDTTDGYLECDEPLRMLWYACKTEAGKAAVRAAKINRVVCRGASGDVGSLSIAGGVITVERSVAETQAGGATESTDPGTRPGNRNNRTGPERPFVRSHRQFESAMKLSLALASEDPYYDHGWNELALSPNPVTSTTDYCLVNGKKVSPEENERAPDTFFHHQEDATVKCWDHGQLITDLTIKKGLKNGLYTEPRTNGWRRATYRDDKLHGRETMTVNGKPKWIGQYEMGEEQWHKDFHASGKLERYWRRLPAGRAEVRLAEDGRVYALHCTPEVRDDEALRGWCGFDGKRTVSIFDGTGKISRIETWKGGVLQEAKAGTSAYASGSTVSYKDGKKHGEERIVDATGKLRQTIEWDRGVQDGKHREFAEDGKRIVKETVWKQGEVRELTELYLNGNPKRRETFETPTRKVVKRFWDSGKVQEEGVYLACNERTWGGRDWCADGKTKTYYESGAVESELGWTKGKRDGVAKSWWPDGKPRSLEEYADDKRTKSKQWNKDGKLTVDEEYEADGSRKLHR